MNRGTVGYGGEDIEQEPSFLTKRWNKTMLIPTPQHITIADLSGRYTLHPLYEEMAIPADLRCHEEMVQRENQGLIRPRASPTIPPATV